ncbi:acyl-CoA-like ligand-binding transcription factor [Streptomonospora nanhaiensis]|uniref:acyl-CoA-like ligand-binding transcription factor n=1 Tax=Streptomonospora nanhaiensis TaxID=1323731 RepID=UPI001C391F30|nr:TetR family transcriptional regulator [Streptomonospora nanhaiensis]MBV2362414.1 TetR family transcriptional regulator [Streptomonospora nanhaiensis]
MDAEDPAPPGLRERKKQRTRLALSWAAIRLSVERGYANVRVEDIADEVGVSARTFSNYFASKGEAIAARQLDRARLIADELRARPASEPLWTAIRNAARARIALDRPTDGQATPDDQWIAGVRLMLTEPALQAEMFRISAAAHDALAAAVADRVGVDPEDLYPQLVAGSVGAAMQAAVRRWLRADPPGPFAPLLDDAIGRLPAGLPPP